MRHSLTSGIALFEVLVSLLLLSLLFFGLDGVELSALYLNRKAYFAALAEQQVDNLEERLRLVGAGAGLDQALRAWNAENQQILPQGRGRLSGHYPDYRITLAWGKAGERFCAESQEGEAGCVNDHFIL